MIRSLLWLCVWLATLCAADIRVTYADGLTITFDGWWGAFSRWKHRSTDRAARSRE